MIKNQKNKRKSQIRRAKANAARKGSKLLQPKDSQPTFQQFIQKVKKNRFMLSATN